jgi:hypothetical protein
MGFGEATGVPGPKQPEPKRQKPIGSSRGRPGSRQHSGPIRPGPPSGEQASRTEKTEGPKVTRINSPLIPQKATSGEQKTPVRRGSSEERKRPTEIAQPTDHAHEKPMRDDQEFRALSDKLTTAVGDLAELRKQRSELLDAGEAAGADQLNASLTDCSIEILELRLQLMEKERLSDSQNLHDAITSLLQDLRPVLAASDRPSEWEHLWNAAVMVGLTTLATAVFGAPLAALATHQLVGQKMLEDAIETFTSVALVEAALEVRNHRKRRGSKN